MIDAVEALERLRAGNLRFARGQRPRTLPPHQRRELDSGQSPYAIVLGCSDSRVPVETVFDALPGELFVVRVAGNVAASASIASIEFAAGRFGSRLVVVLGHTGCGAVSATLEDLISPQAQPSRHLREVVSLVRPALLELSSGSPREVATLMAPAVRANVHAMVARVRDQSPVLGPMVANGELVVVGARYDLESGVVEFLDPPAQEAPR